MEWNDDWRTELEETNYRCYERLCDCRNIRKDIVTITKLMIKYNPTFDKKECLERTLEWIGDWNNQFEITDMTKDEYNDVMEKCGILTEVDLLKIKVEKLDGIIDSLFELFADLDENNILNENELKELDKITNKYDKILDK